MSNSHVIVDFKISFECKYFWKQKHHHHMASHNLVDKIEKKMKTNSNFDSKQFSEMPLLLYLSKMYLNGNWMRCLVSFEYFVKDIRRCRCCCCDEDKYVIVQPFKMWLFFVLQNVQNTHNHWIDENQKSKCLSSMCESTTKKEKNQMTIYAFGVHDVCVWWQLQTAVFTSQF